MWFKLVKRNAQPHFDRRGINLQNNHRLTGLIIFTEQGIFGVVKKYDLSQRMTINIPNLFENSISILEIIIYERIIGRLNLQIIFICPNAL